MDFRGWLAALYESRPGLTVDYPAEQDGQELTE